MSLGFTQVTIALILKGVLNSRYKKHAGWLETRSAPTLGASSSDQPTAAPPVAPCCWRPAGGKGVPGEPEPGASGRFCCSINDKAYGRPQKKGTEKEKKLVGSH